MAKYWVDFCGYCCVEAENENEVETKVQAAINQAFDGKTIYDEVWDIECIEERTDDDLFAVIERPAQLTIQELEDFFLEK